MSNKLIEGLSDPELKGMSFEDAKEAATPYHDIALKREHDFARRVPYLEDVFVRALMYYLQSKRDMTPGSKLLDEDLAKDLAEPKEIERLYKEVRKKGEGRHPNWSLKEQRKISKREKETRDRKKEFDPEDQDQVARKEYEGRGTEAEIERLRREVIEGEGEGKDKTKKMTNFERTLKMRKKLEDMIRDDNGKD
jgi:hypothetical protein